MKKEKIPSSRCKSGSRQECKIDSDFRRNDNKFVGILLLLLGFLYFFYTIFSNSKFLFKKYDSISAEKIYSQSQWQQSQNISEIKVLDEWALKNGYTGWRNFEDETVNKLKIESQKLKVIQDIKNKGVSDSFLYSYVGYKYMKGANPSLLNPEHPPLAKYLIGYSIQLFGSEHSMGIGVAFLILLLGAIISYQLYSSLFLAGLTLFLTSIFPLFTDQITHGPQLELYQLFFFLLVIHFLLMGKKKNNTLFIIGAGIFFGMLLSTKTFLPFFVLFSAWIALYFWKRWKMTVMVIGIGVFVFVATYWQYFALGGTLRTFLGVQKYIFIFYGNAQIPLFEFMGNYLRLIFTGSWKFWDSARSISAYSEWNILWPLLFLLGMLRIKSRWTINPSSRLLIIFIILYNIFVFIIPVFPRYLLLLFVPLIILI